MYTIPKKKKQGYDVCTQTYVLDDTVREELNLRQKHLHKTFRRDDRYKRVVMPFKIKQSELQTSAYVTTYTGNVEMVVDDGWVRHRHE